jgi:hypothetical protein
MVVRPQSPDEQEASQSSVRLVGDFAVPFGMFPVRVESVAGLVTCLHGTGSDPQPSRYRNVLLSEMRARGVESPNAVLASPDTALVLVRGFLRPGVQKGDRFDVEVRVPSGSGTTSLRGGTLLEVDLRELAVLDRVRSGHVLAKAAGPIMVDPSAEGEEDRVRLTRGRILGGGVALKSRPLGLVLKPESQSVWNSSRIETAVNKRFFSAYKGTKVGVAKAKTDKYIELRVHPKYTDNIERYMRVVRAIALRESESERQNRLASLERQLLDPISSSRAALQLEAIGRQATEVLLKGLEAEDAEVRFRAAEALAYLDRSEAAEPLARAAQEQPAFRVFALAALAAMDDLAAADELRELLNGTSAETRYGAFRALSETNRRDPAIKGEVLGGQFLYHVLDTSGTPMIHVTRSRRPEIVLFGKDQRLHPPFVLDAGNEIMVVATGPDHVAVSKYEVNAMNQRRIVSHRVDNVIRAVVQLGGTYPDVVQALQQAKDKQALTSRLAVDALPEAGRTYDRLAEAASESGESAGETGPSGGPHPHPPTKMVGPMSPLKGRSGDKSATRASKTADSAGGQHPVKAFFAKMVGREAVSD